ncbi:sensor histidine kinase [Lutimaribacter marinistellae]|uniref:histidine kinase n=1 Tax=Lutimaribacter marinistellae TaxID=1820329 RepID=A0ABV7TL67_9RHOB
MSRDLFPAVTSLTGDGLCLCEIVTDGDGRPVDYLFVDINAQFEEMTGLANAKGHTARQLVPDLEQHWIDSYARVGIGRETLHFENSAVPMGRWFEVHAAPGPVHGQLWILFRDVTARKLAEQARAEALEASQRLFAELSHRVKNSLAMISSIVSMEARGQSGEAREALSRVQLRIAALAQLYDVISDAGAISEISAAPYIEGIVDGLRGSLVQGGKISILSEIEELTLPSRLAVPIGLIVNELVTNSLKHGFKAGDSGHVRVALWRREGCARLEIEDDGRGQKVKGASKGTGLGMQLIEAFVADLGGEMRANSDTTGTSVSITFPLPAN